MNMPWDVLNAKTASFRTLLETPDDDGKIRDAVFSGLYVKLSDIVKGRAPGTGKTLTIYADTLVMDLPSFDAATTVVVARTIDVSSLTRGEIRVPVLAGGQPAMSVFLIQESAGGGVSLIPAKPATGVSTTAVAVGSAPLQVVYYTVESDGKSSSEIQTNAAYLQDLLDKVWALNSLKASFTAATWLMDSDSPADRLVARSMLNWVCSCVRAVGENGAVVPSDYAELYQSAAALLVTSNVGSGADYVPVLASDYYNQQLNTLFDVLSKYESTLRALNTQSSVQAALQSAGSTLQGTVDDSLVPLGAELDSLQGNIDNLFGDIQVLRRQFDIQLLESDAKLKLLTAEMIKDQIYRQMEQILSASFQILTAVGSAGASISALKINPAASLKAFTFQGADSGWIRVFDKSGNPESALPTLKKIGETIADGGKGAMSIYKAAKGSKTPGGNELLTRALALMTMQEQAITAFVAGASLLGAPPEGATQNLPEIEAADRVDPALAWDNFLVDVETFLKPMESSDSGSVISALAAFHGSLKILAQYGKAINAKLEAAASQTSEATLVRARLFAAENTKRRWADLVANAKSDDEKLAALKGIIQVRMDSIKRSVFASWNQYRNSFFYLNFQEPPRAINMDMNAADLAAGFASVTAWIARLRGDTPEATQIRLPDDKVRISFNFKVVKRGEAVGAGTALLTPQNGSQPATLTWTIASGDDQLTGVLPSKGQVAIWIREAKFFPTGVTPNSKGKVIAKVSTSGSYQNGFGPQRLYSFETKSLVGNYAYTVADEVVYNRWKIDTEVYSTPTPFTQWTMTFDPDGGDPATASELRMDLVVAYSEGARMASSAGRA
jgi:hypothetical protein